MHLSQLHVKAGELPFVAGKVSETKRSRQIGIYSLNKSLHCNLITAINHLIILL